MHTALDDHFGIGTGGLLGERERITDEVGDAVEDLRGLVVVRQDDCITGPLELLDRRDQWRMHRPLHFGNDMLDTLVYGHQTVGQFGRPCRNIGGL